MLPAVSVSLLQLIAVPLVALGLGRVRFFGARVPGSLLLLGTALSITVGVIGMSPRGATHGLLIGRFSDDELGTRSRIFREQLAASLQAVSTLDPIRFPGAIADQADALKQIRSSGPGGALVWGTTRWLSVTFASHRGNPVLRVAAAEMGGLVPAEPPGLFGISNAGDVETVGFLGDLFLATISRGYRGESAVPRASLDEVMLLGAQRRQARWSSSAHRGVPALLLGDRYLEEAIGGSSYQPAALRCALTSYATGTEQLRSGDNPELRAALFNNWAIALWTESLYEPRMKGARKKARRLLNLAVKTKREPNLYRVELKGWKTARKNLKVMKKRGINVQKGKPARRRRP